MAMDGSRAAMMVDASLGRSWALDAYLKRQHGLVGNLA
jgi:hypothetical protein